jgi:hypothetical protein
MRLAPIIRESWRLVRSVPNVAPAPPSCCRLATAKPCSYISTRSQPKSPSERTPLSSLIRPDGMAPKPWWFRTTSHSCRCRRAHPNSTARKNLAVHASELVVKPDFQILRRYRRPLLLRLEHTHRPTLEDYVHRATRPGSSRSLNLRIGITPSSRHQLSRIAPAHHGVASGTPSL